MGVSALLDLLNRAQRDAVSTSAQHVLVLAGAGSGKTRVLTHRIAWQIEVQGLSPYAIVAVTFTNKAANEMRARLESLLAAAVQGMWFGTFHGLCYRLLRRHWQEAGLVQGFQLMDAQDQRRLIKRILQDLRLDEARWQPKRVQWFIEQHKDQGVRAQDVQDQDDKIHGQLTRIYAEYERVCARSGLIDFSELLLRAIEMLRDNNGLRQMYHERFRAILVDEFQDTNRLQYAWIRTLASADTSVFIVGDDDQSIYSWRGACSGNIQDFSRDFPDAQVYRLEQNYRSTQTILNVANALIRNNRARWGKELWTDGEQGKPVLLFAACNERDEARFVVARVKAWLRDGNPASHVAILYRSNAQSRVFEELLVAANMSYHVYGGMRFFERAVVKDVLAYLRLAHSYEDDTSFERIVNMPPRGIGIRTLEALRTCAHANGTSLWEAGSYLQKTTQLSASAAAALANFHDLIKQLKDAAAATLAEQVEHAITLSELRGHYARMKDEKSRSNVENIDELITAAASFEGSQLPDEGLTVLETFLIHTALGAGERQSGSSDDCIQMMTLHSAKGLEFPLVFMVGLEEGLFPHALASENAAGLEEERRLCYVGITRARQQLVMSYRQTRLYRSGRTAPNMLSRFVKELPEELVEEVTPVVRRNPDVRSSKCVSAAADNAISVGQTVRHDKFGRGVVLASEGSNANARVQVHFDNIGTKWLAVAYANLSID